MNKKKAKPKSIKTPNNPRKKSKKRSSDIEKARELATLLLNRLEDSIAGNAEEIEWGGKEDPVSILAKLTQILSKLSEMANPADVKAENSDDGDEKITDQDIQILEEYVENYKERKKNKENQE